MACLGFTVPRMYTGNKPARPDAKHYVEQRNVKGEIEILADTAWSHARDA
jgi:hypothetical protein